jgi:hypothetical protein
MSSYGGRACHPARPSANAPERHLAWGDFIFLLDFLERSNIRGLTMLGAEPARNPAVVDMLDYALARGFDAYVRTSGAIGGDSLGHLSTVLNRHPGKGVRFVVGAPASDEASREAADFLGFAGPRASLSVAIGGPKLDLDVAFDAIERFHLERTIRISLSVRPSLGGATPARLDPYRAIADALEVTFARFRATGVTPAFDCGIPSCMFTDAQLGALTKLGARLNPTCDGVVDIGPGLELWPGFDVVQLQGQTLYGFERMGQVVARVHDTLAHQRARDGILSECTGCDIRARNLCLGGCIAHQFSEVPIEQVNPAPNRRSLPLV